MKSVSFTVNPKLKLVKANTDNSNAIATTAYVQNVIAALVARIEALENK